MGLYKRGRIWWVSYMVADRQRRESSHSTNKRVAKNLLAIRQAQVLEGRLQLPQNLWRSANFNMRRRTARSRFTVAERTPKLSLFSLQGFLDLWRDADPDIPILKEAKAEYAKLQ